MAGRADDGVDASPKLTRATFILLVVGATLLTALLILLVVGVIWPTIEGVFDFLMHTVFA